MSDNTNDPVVRGVGYASDLVRYDANGHAVPVADTPTHEALRQCSDAITQLIACHDEPECPALEIGRAALAAADAALSVQAEPRRDPSWNGPMVAATPQPPAPVPAVPPGWAFYTADFSMKAHENAPVGHAMLVRTGDDYRAWFTLSDEDRDRIPLYIQGAGPTIQEAIAEACKAALSAHNITGAPDHG